MRKQGMRRYVQLMLLAAFLVGVSATSVYATSSTSDNYQVTETQFGSGSTLESCSGQYCARASIGDLSVGQSSSPGGTTATFGAVTEGEPLMEVIVENGESNLGILTTETTATKTMKINVRSYLTGGYTLQLTGEPPKYGDHIFSTSSSPTSATPGKEQFAINATANTVPEVGAIAEQIPSTEMSFGYVDEKYNVANLFKYTSGEVIARSDTESGQTRYTISMIVNISNSTPAGHFSGDFSAIVVPAY